MTQNLFTLFPRALSVFYELSRCIVVNILLQQCNDGNGELKSNQIYMGVPFKFKNVCSIVSNYANF